MSELRARELSCIRSERVVFAKLGFSVQAGEILTLTGANGSGKSSLLRILAGLLRPAGGDITWSGARIDDDAEAHRARLHYLGHRNALKPVLTAEENLRFWAHLQGAKPSAGTLEAALDAFGVAELAALPAGYLSAGQQRRVALARLLATEVPLWLLDEPATSLDAAAAAALEAAIARHAGGGGIAIIATHDAIVAAQKNLDLGTFAGGALANELLDDMAEPA
jgi:heme exporter protein A